MTLAINLRADNASAAEIERLWDQVAAFEDEPSMRTLGYRPHLTFAIYDSPGIDESTACDAMRRATANQTQLRIAFRRIRWFEGSPLVLWAEPAATPALTRTHASISAAIDPAHCRPHYRPGAWTPHCTLGMRIADRRRDRSTASPPKPPSLRPCRPALNFQLAHNNRVRLPITKWNFLDPRNNVW